MNTARTACLACALFSAAASSAPLTFNTALPVREGGWVLREQLIEMRNDDDPSPANRAMRVRGLVSVLGYGVTRDLAVFGVLPYLDKRLDMTAGGGAVRARDEGLGDLVAIARYTVHERNERGRTWRIAPFLGVKAPTGTDDARDGERRLPPPVQLGSGSWDLLGGVIATYQTLEFQLDGQVSYRANRAANGVELGDVLQLDGSLQYRLWPRTLGSGVPGFLYGVLETTVTHAAKNRALAAADPDSGGTTVFLTPGLQYVTRKWIVEGGVQLPVRQRLNGNALRSDYLVTVGFRVNF